MLFNVFKRKLFGEGLSKLLKYILISVIVFFGLKTAEVSIQIAPFIKNLMSGTFTAGLMWHSLASENSSELSGIAMLPFRKHSFTFSYTGAYGLYNVITKSMPLIAVMSAVSAPAASEICGMIICTLNGVFTASAVYVLKKHRIIGFIWAAACVASVFTEYALILLSVNLIFSLIVLLYADPYNFINGFSANTNIRASRNHSVWKYLFRYMTTHKNYLINSAAMWAVGIVLPFLMNESVGTAFLPMGFAILSINTPLCVLISADPALDEAIRFLPSGTRMFCLPYFFFIAFNNLIAYTFYLVSFGVQTGGFEIKNIVLALIFALLGAFGSVFMEMKFPVKNYKTESDLWHHPRKYVIPAILLVLSVIACTV
ncbi:MAG: hypothetical protein IJZ65_09880 [Ruminiclostridium sp.]|nr:hypothetical protein [Ruminiclostridium sp.]